MDKREIRNLINNSSPVIFEIGCADGKDTLDFIQTFNDLSFKMYCFEPEPRNAKVFRDTVHDGRVYFHEKAVGDISNSQTPFHQSNTEYSSSLLEHTEDLTKQWPVIKFENTLFIEKVSLDDFVESEKIDRIDFIWADVQGAEHLLIAGAKKTLREKVKYFYTEYSDIAYYKGEQTLEQILSLLPDFKLVWDFKTDVLLVNKYL